MEEKEFADDLNAFIGDEEKQEDKSRIKPGELQVSSKVSRKRKLNDVVDFDLFKDTSTTQENNQPNAVAPSDEP